VSRARLLIAGLLTVALLCLLGWQFRRERLLKACLERGGAWTGTACGPRPILRRDLQHS
jgi:hypothetical protein